MDICKMKLKALINKPEINLKKGQLYEIDEIIQDCYRIKVPMKQKGKFKYALVKDDEGVLVD